MSTDPTIIYTPDRQLASISSREILFAESDGSAAVESRLIS